jgi:hypothetical protein
VELATAPVWIPTPSGTLQRAAQPVVAAWVIRIGEAHLPAGVEGLEWILITSAPTQTLEYLRQGRDWYACCWSIAGIHDIENNGCREQDRPFETGRRLEACLAILSILAVRIFQLRTALEAQPSEPAQQLATQEKIQVRRRCLNHTKGRLTVRDFVRGVARLGGFLGRKHNGEPEVRTLRRGCQRLQDLLLGYRFRGPSPGGDVGDR